MRLCRIEGSRVTLVEIFGKDIPPYAILSHRWGEDHEEITFQDLKEGKERQRKLGYRKLRFCRQQAKKDGLGYFWIDTCCIDKKNSTELAEAINSMFQYYQDAKICYVYLADVSKSENDIADQDRLQQFRDSQWFLRGWTLQELLAPAVVEFFSKEKRMIGNKQSLVHVINQVTGIDIRALRGEPLSAFSIDERLSWASNRRTKREEDIVYSLLGIFDVKMLPIYSEGCSRAFVRLEKEIREKASPLGSTMENAYNGFRKARTDETEACQGVEDTGSQRLIRKDQDKNSGPQIFPFAEADKILDCGTDGAILATIARQHPQQKLLQKRLSLAKRRETWNKWPEHETELFKALSRWLSDPQSSTFLVTADPEQRSAQQATDFAAKMCHFIISKGDVPLIWALSFPIHPSNDTLTTRNMVDVLLVQASALLSHCRSGQTIESVSTPGVCKTKLLYRTLNEYLLMLSNCFVILETDHLVMLEELQKLQEIVDLRPVGLKIMIVVYGNAAQEASKLGKNKNTIMCRIGPTRKGVSNRYKWEQLQPFCSK